MKAVPALGAPPSRTTLVRCVWGPPGFEYVNGAGPWRETDDREHAHRFTAAEAATWIAGQRGERFHGPEDFITEIDGAAGELVAGAP